MLTAQLKNLASIFQGVFFSVNFSGQATFPNKSSNFIARTERKDASLFVEDAEMRLGEDVALAVAFGKRNFLHLK